MLDQKDSLYKFEQNSASIKKNVNIKPYQRKLTTFLKILYKIITTIVRCIICDTDIFFKINITFLNQIHKNSKFKFHIDELSCKMNKESTHISLSKLADSG